MNKDTRMQKIQEIVNRDKDNPFGRQEIPWEDGLETMDVYKIPLEYLIYNKYNGRILSRTKSLENQKHIIDVEIDAGKILIEKLLWNSKPERNKKTQESLTKYGQEKVGIITRDGIIIDGNRRAMLLNKIDHVDYFKAVVLPVTLEENKIEIEKFETTYQLGEDQKLDYNPIEIYLKIQTLYKQLSGKSIFSEKDVDKSAIIKIYEWIGNYKNIKSANDIEYTLMVMNTMDDYLDSLDYNGIYTALDEREEQFRGLTTWLNLFYGESSGKAFDNYRNDDIDDLRDLCFDLIRIKYKNDKFRYVAQGQKPNHFLGNQELWSSFQEKHFVEKEKYKELDINFNSSDIESHLNSRDSDFKLKVGTQLNDNVDSHYQQLRNNQASDEPEKLLKRSIDSFNSINTGHKNFSNSEVQDLVKELGGKVFDVMKKKSPSGVLSHIISLLESIDIENIPESENKDVLTKTKRIQQLGYQINKQL